MILSSTTDVQHVSFLLLYGKTFCRFTPFIPLRRRERGVYLRLVSLSSVLLMVYSPVRHRSKVRTDIPTKEMLVLLLPVSSFLERFLFNGHGFFASSLPSALENGVVHHAGVWASMTHLCARVEATVTKKMSNAW